ncbi:MAG: hypothetical protein AAFX99_00140 [Myxococcota bacterium]
MPKAKLAVCCATAIVALVACDASSENSNDAASDTDASSDFDAASNIDAAPDSTVDAQEAPTFELTVGTGRDAFEPLDADGVLVLERGPQGLQHVFVSLRAPIAEGLHLIDLSITSDDRVVSAPTRVNAPFVSVPDEDFAELVGQLVVVPEPSGALDVPATLRARVEPSVGGFGEVDREVRIRW